MPKIQRQVTPDNASIYPNDLNGDNPYSNWDAMQTIDALSLNLFGHVGNGRGATDKFGRAAGKKAGPGDGIGGGD